MSERMTPAPHPVTFEYRDETGYVWTYDGHLVAVPREGDSVSWDDGHAALTVQSAFICAEGVIVRVKGLMRTGSIPTYQAGGWKR